MGWLGNVKNAVVHAGHQLGDLQNNKWVKGAEMAGLAASGVGAPAAAALMATGGLVGGAIRSGGGLKGAVTGAGQGALQGATAGLAGSGLRGIASKFGASAASKALPSGGTPTSPGGATYDSNGEPITSGGGYSGPTEGPGGGGGSGGLLSGIGGFLARNKSNILDLGSAAESAYGNYQGAKKYADNAPLRSAGRAGLLDTSTPDLSGVLGPQGTPPQYRNVAVGSRGRMG